MESINNETVLSLPSVATQTGLSAATVLEAVKSGPFPLPVDFNGYEVWLSADIADWLENSPHSPSNFAWKEAA
jgi:predicted DNA-binding transcriptional regulator AlpA